MSRVVIKTIDKQFYAELGRQIFEVRRKRGYSLRYLSELTGISRVTLDNYELGRYKINPEIYETICKVLQISPKIGIKIDIGIV